VDVRYLSPEWLAAAADAIAHDAGLQGAAADISLILEQTVTDGPDGTVSWHIVLHRGTARLVPGSAAQADLRFTTTWSTACAVALGELAAPTAFLEGRLRVGGNLTLLVGQQQKLSSIDDVLGDLRSVTTFA
jgi:hypothetical protein